MELPITYKAKWWNAARARIALKGARCVPSLLFSSITLESSDSRVIFFPITYVNQDQGRWPNDIYPEPRPAIPGAKFPAVTTWYTCLTPSTKNQITTATITAERNRLML